jgi:hypothetical protein
VSLVVFAVLAAAPPAAAQSETAESDYRSPELLTPETSARGASATLPLDLLAPAEVHRLAEQMWHKSPTFRRQATRLAAAPGLRIAIRQGQRRSVGTTRAETTCYRERGLLARAEMWIPIGPDAIELLAHELEHIIEQLDEVDLPALQKHAGSGVHAGPVPGQFETIRAMTVGQLVAKEMKGGPVVMAAR